MSLFTFLTGILTNSLLIGVFSLPDLWRIGLVKEVSVEQLAVIEMRLAAPYQGQRSLSSAKQARKVLMVSRSSSEELRPRACVPLFVESM